MSLQSLAAPKRFPVIMLKTEKVCTDGRGITSEQFEAGQEALVPLDVARSLVRDATAKWKGQPPPEPDKKPEEFLVEERRKAAAFPGFSFIKTEGPVAYFNHQFTLDNKFIAHEFAAVFMDMTQWEKSPDWKSSDPSRCASWTALADMSVGDYLLNPPHLENLNYTITRFVQALNGEMTGALLGAVRFSFPLNSRARVGVAAGGGGLHAFFLCDAKAISHTTRTRIRDFETFHTSRYGTIWMDELSAWQNTRFRG